MRSVALVLEEIRRLQRNYRLKTITFPAETFTIDREYILELCAGLSSFSTPVSWFCGSRVDLLDEELVIAMRAAGCTGVVLGIESGSQEVLDSVNKGARLDQARSVVEVLKRHHLVVTANFILGLPGDTLKSLLESIGLAIELDLDFATFTMFTPFPGAPLTRFVETTAGYGVITRDWDRYDTQSPRYIIRNPNLPGPLVELLHKWAYMRFYFRYGKIGKLFQIVTTESIVDYFLWTIRSYLPGMIPRGEDQ